MGQVKGAARLNSGSPLYLQSVEGQTCLICISSHPAPQKAKVGSLCTLMDHGVPVNVRALVSNFRC